MAYCILCGKKLGFMEPGVSAFEDGEGRLVCYDCIQMIKTDIKPIVIDLTKQGIDILSIQKEVASRVRVRDFEDTRRYISDYVEVVVKEELEAKQQQVKMEEIEKSRENMIVTTGDLKQEYDVIGYVYFQLSNKGIFTSTYTDLLQKYTDKIRDLQKNKLLSKEKVDWGFLYGEWSVGQNDFEKAFYVAVEELKKRAKNVRSGCNYMYASRC